MEFLSSFDDDAKFRARLGEFEVLHRQLRPMIGDYAAHMNAMLDEGVGMCVMLDGGAPVALAVYRHHLTTFIGRRFYVDDLVTDENARSKSYGGALLEWLQGEAVRLNCDMFTLESGVQRFAAHKFYFKHGMHIAQYGFIKEIK